ncbi:DUF1552 domain-containing protein [soil metagenome]
MITRRHFLRELGVSAAALPFLSGLPDLMGAPLPQRRQRLIIMFSPNGTIPEDFWSDQQGDDFEFKSILKPLEPFRERSLLLNGISNKIQGDGDRHMRGMSCLLTGTELLPGNIQGGSDTPAGWASGISIDQEIRNFLQSQKETQTRFGSLEYGIAVPDRADPWTRMSYAGPNKPIAPIDDPNRMLGKLYGQMKDKDSLVSILDDVRDDLGRIASKLSARDKAMLADHLEIVRSMEREMERADQQSTLDHPIPEVDPSIELVNDNTPEISRIQIDLLVNSLANDMARVATLQYMRSVGQARMKWLDVEEGHHSLSHEPDDNNDAREKLKKINTWFAGEFAYLAKRLSETPEPAGDGTMLDNTLLVWTNELGKGNSHTLDNIPYVLCGGGADFKMGRSLNFHAKDSGNAPHNRLWLAIAHAMGHRIETFGNPDLCQGGPLALA